jgi:tRNA nucleotidyltransferase (CCA-adding enzyme)
MSAAIVFARLEKVQFSVQEVSMFRKVIALVALLTVVMSAGCSLLSHEAPPEDVDKATALFFQRLDNGDYDTIYNDLSKRFKENKTRQTVTESLKQLAFGKVVSYERVSMRFQGEGKDRMLIPVYMATFEQGAGDLTLTFQDEDGEWKLLAFEFKRRR